jgi:hypothetical protein
VRGPRKLGSRLRLGRRRLFPREKASVEKDTFCWTENAMLLAGDLMEVKLAWGVEA